MLSEAVDKKALSASAVAPYFVPVKRDLLREAYDRELREEGEVGGAQDVVRDGPLLWAVFDHGGFVTYRDLGGMSGPDLDAAIARTIAHFRDRTDVTRVEWKTRGHDLPEDLAERLVAHGFVAEDVETVMVGEAAALLDAPGPPEGVVVRRVGSTGDARADLVAMLALQEEVFGPGRSPRLERMLASHESGEEEFWLAEGGGRVVATGSVRPVEGTHFAGIWGGAVHPQWRGRGVYRALVAERARVAVERGVRYMHSDCTDMSRPILERSGLVAVTSTTPYVWTR